ncbi:MAG TPA: hypothetical protein DDW78_07010 [Treponema sp.]|nr:hypothetical protein [Treponema sp.]
MNLDKSLFIADYISEAREILDSLDELFIQASKQRRNSGSLKEMLRLMHTLKGSSRMLEFTQIESVVNRQESLFKLIQHNQTEIPVKIIQLQLGISSVLHTVMEQIEKGSDGSFAAYDAIMDNLDKALEDEDFITDFSRADKPSAGPRFLPGEAEDDESGFLQSAQTIKVQVSRIDDILQAVDKLIMGQIKLKKEVAALKTQAASDDFHAHQEVMENIAVLEKQSADIQKSIISLRMLPFDMILQPIKRSVVSEALKLKKNVEFNIPRSEIGIDRAILERMPAILIHLVRNAIDHGIEPAEERLRLGKPAAGTITLTVAQASSRISVCVKDDGRGIDFERIRQKAIVLYPEREKEIVTEDKNGLLQYLFVSGFSTKDSPTELSGRGIGLDVVRTEMDRLKGKISIRTEEGQGTEFELSLPASLATQDGMFVSVSGNSYLILSHYIKEILSVKKSDFLRMQHGPVLNVNNELIPVYDFDIINTNAAKSAVAQDKVSVIILEYLNKKIGMTVDAILRYGTVVIKPVPPLLKDFSALQGVVFDENYRIIPVLNIPDILRRFKIVSIYDVKNLEVRKMHKIHSVLVVDDSHTTRHIEQIILEAENYNVMTAVDGIDALEKMKQHEFDLVITDVKMPRMDGFVLIHNMRHNEDLKHIPVIVISSVFESDTEEKVRNLGAQGYIVKSDFERENLIAKVKELLHG